MRADTNPAARNVAHLDQRSPPRSVRHQEGSELAGFIELFPVGLDRLRYRRAERMWNGGQAAERLRECGVRRRAPGERALEGGRQILREVNRQVRAGTADAQPLGVDDGARLRPNLKAPDRSYTVGLGR